MYKNTFEKSTFHQGYDNNRCSGYALAPILIDINKYDWLCKEKDNHALGTLLYENLCDCQQKMLHDYTEQNVSMIFLSSLVNIVNDTRMILPSSIVTYCHNLELSPKVIYSPKRESIFGKEVFEEDCTRMVDFLYLVDDYDEIEREAAQYRYLVALTRFKHWVSLKATLKGYYLYDPAPAEFQGGIFGPDSFRNLLPDKKEGGKFFYDMVIGLLPIKEEK